MPNTDRETYVDLYLLPVPQGNLEAYRGQATTFGQITKEYGALSYREWVGDGSGEGVTAEEGTLLALGIVEFSSREHRDEVMDKVMADPRVDDLMQGEALADMGQMRYGGFTPLVTI